LAEELAINLRIPATKHGQAYFPLQLEQPGPGKVGGNQRLAANLVKAAESNPEAQKDLGWVKNSLKSPLPPCDNMLLL
jgi:hypothetical protein